MGELPQSALQHRSDRFGAIATLIKQGRPNARQQISDKSHIKAQ